MVVPQLAGLVQVVGDHDDGDPEVMLQPFQFQAQPVAGGIVQGREGFVQEQHVRCRGQGLGQGGPLPFTAGDLLRPLVRQVADAQHGEQLADPLRVPAAVGHVFFHVQVGEEGMFLEDIPHLPLPRLEQDPLPGAEPGLLPIADRAAIGAFQAGKGPDDRGLAGSRWTGQDQEIAIRAAQPDIDDEPVAFLDNVCLKHDGNSC